MRDHNNQYKEVKIIQNSKGYTIKHGDSDITVKEFSLLVQKLSELFDLMEPNEELYVTPVAYLKRNPCRRSKN